MLCEVKKQGEWKGTKRNHNVNLLFAFLRGAGNDVSNMFQEKDTRFWFILGTETDADPQTETSFEFGSD